MDIPFVLVQFLNGLASASALFIIASGLTIVFGVTRIVNFAHGSLYMLGAYLGVTIIPKLIAVSATFPMFLLGVLLAALCVGLLGVLMELLLLRRIYHAPELLQLLATFGIVLVVQDLVIKLWGPLDILGPRAPGFNGAVDILGKPVPSYELFLIAMGPIVLLGLWFVLQKTRFGVLVRAATQDREMVAALGVNQGILFTATLFLGASLAGLGGALQTPRLSATPQMDIAILTEAFAVTVIGGMGSIPGAFIAAFIIGQLQAFGILVFPKSTIVLVFLLMAAVLIVRPQGLLGRPDTANSRVILPEGFLLLKPPGPTARNIALGVMAVLVLLPLIADAYTLKVAIEVLIFALAAFALSFLIGNAGIVSFGHAAYFGLGAYAAGLGVKALGLGMVPALILAPVVGGLGALVCGIFLVRAIRHLSRHADAGLRADRVRHSLPVGCCDGRRQRCRRCLASQVGITAHRLLLPGVGRNVAHNLGTLARSSRPAWLCTQGYARQPATRRRHRHERRAAARDRLRHRRCRRRACGRTLCLLQGFH